MGKQNSAKGWHPDIVLAGVGIQEKHCRITHTSEEDKREKYRIKRLSNSTHTSE